MAVDIVATLRGIVFYHRDKEWAKSNIWIVVFIILFILSVFLTWQGPSSLLMTSAMILNTFSFSFTKPKLVRSTILISSPLVLIYNILTGSIGGIINEVCVELSSIIGLLRYDIKRKVDK